MKNLDFLPENGLSSAWLAQLYSAHTFRSKARGKDGVRQGQFSRNLDGEIKLIKDKIESGSYDFTAYREMLISRGHKRYPRQISVPTIRDRLTLRAVLEHLKHAFPEAISPPPHRYIKEIKNQLKSVRENSSFLRMDIRDFYPSIEHERLLKKLKDRNLDQRFVKLISSAIETPTGDAKERPTIGVPQGLSISNMLASIYMLDFDQACPTDTFYKRYVDDILIVAPSEKIKSTYEDFHGRLAAIGLKSHPMGKKGKTEEARVTKSIQYLGYEISKRRVSVRKDSLARMFNNLAKVLTSIRKGKDQQRHLYRLNLKITGCIINNSRRGWIMFFSQTEDKSQLAFLDEWLRKQLAETPDLNLDGIKTFKRAYYQIRYNLSKTKYIPNFDSYDLSQKTEVIGILSNRSDEQIAAMDIEAIEVEFSRLIGREISELEKDLLKAFS